MNELRLANQQLEYVMSLAIQLLSNLDKTRAQLRTLKSGEDGRMIVTPGDCLALDAGLALLHRLCREIPTQ